MIPLVVQTGPTFYQHVYVSKMLNIANKFDDFPRMFRRSSSLYETLIQAPLLCVLIGKPSGETMITLASHEWLGGPRVAIQYDYDCMAICPFHIHMCLSIYVYKYIYIYVYMYARCVHIYTSTIYLYMTP